MREETASRIQCKSCAQPHEKNLLPESARDQNYGTVGTSKESQSLYKVHSFQHDHEGALKALGVRNYICRL